MLKNIEGFSKLTKKEKIDWVVRNHFKEPEKAKEIILSYNHQKEDIQKVHDEFIENSLSNFFLPFGVAPNFLINNKDRIAQMILTPVIKMDLEETDDLPETIRGESGFGSTGK